MSENDDFCENPFRVLDSRLFPQADKRGEAFVRRKRRSTHTKKISKDVLDSCTADDSALFIAAMDRVQPVERKKHTGFLLEDHCSLPTRTKKAKKIRQKKEDHAENVSLKASKEDQVREESEDDALFLQAMSQVDPLQSRGRDVAPVPVAVRPPSPSEDSLQDFIDGKLEFALSLTDEYLEGHVVGLDQMIMNKLRSGALSPEAHLDLHGLNAVQAFEALRGFMRGAWYKGLRTILVVPGRGRNSPDGMGILRSKLQTWLTQEPFKRVVLAFCTAQAHDGGPGSVYVLLRKYRKKGRIYWERMPADADLY